VTISRVRRLVGLSSDSQWRHADSKKLLRACRIAKRLKWHLNENYDGPPDLLSSDEHLERKAKQLFRYHENPLLKKNLDYILMPKNITNGRLTVSNPIARSSAIE
jgi:hypothetical protein